MPLARYFSYVGGVLLALLFVLDAYLPKVPVAERADANLPVIRIHSDRKWPERVVYDTSQPTIIPAQIVSGGPASWPQQRSPTSLARGAKGREREAFAQLQPFDAKQLQPSDSKKREPNLQRQRKIAKRRAAAPALLVARHPQFGWFGNSIW